ncbi:response regulator transcription factor [Caenimonas terrae]|uniref:Response regulator transcription factor n=1 Tax=Caenimonas terrae TaxID=696074 RepID=A0ABW0N7X2_9BURK
MSTACSQWAEPVPPEPRRYPARSGFDTPLLTPRECEALELAARGFSCAEIARLQQVSVHTTRSHLKSVYSKLGVHSKSEAVFEATASGMMRPDFWKVEPPPRSAGHQEAANHAPRIQLVAAGG